MSSTGKYVTGVRGVSIGGLVLAIYLCLSSILTQPALAAIGHKYESRLVEHLAAPWSMAFDSSDNLFAVDGEGVEKFNAENVFQVRLGESYLANQYPQGVAVDDKTGNVYAGSLGAGVVVLTPAGELLSQWYGENAGGFDPFKYVAVDNSTHARKGDVYVLSSFQYPSEGAGEVDVMEPQHEDKEEGKLVGKLEAPGGFAFERSDGLAVNDATGQVYVADPGHHLVDVFGATGSYETQIAGPSPSEPFGDPVDVAVDAATGEVYVLDDAKAVVDEFSAAGKYIGRIDGSSGAPFAEAPRSVAVNAVGDVYVSLGEPDEGTNAIDIFGPDEEGEPPTTVTEAPTGNVGTAATFNGKVQVPKEGVTTEYRFSYNHGPSCTGSGSHTTPVDDGGTPITKSGAVSATVSLEPLTEYTYCLIAESRFGSGQGAGVSLTTISAKPTITSETASGGSSTTMNVRAEINPNRQETTYLVEYASSEAVLGTLGAKQIASTESLPAAFGNRSATFPRVEGLIPGTMYFYRVVAANATGVTEGAVSSFTTAPTPNTDPVDAIVATGATFNGHLSLNAVDTQYFFEYKIGDNCAGESVTETRDAGITPNGTPSFSISVSRLLPHTRYAVCLIARNAFGSETGPAVTFTTLAEEPEVRDEFATDVTSASVVIGAEVDAGGAETSYHIQYGTSAAYGENTPESQAVSSDAGYHQVSTLIQNLQPSTTYHYRVVATNALAPDGIGGPEQTFTTEPGGGELALADGRHWEMVSPPLKQGAYIYAQDSELFEALTVQASANGNAIVFMSNGPTEANPAGSGQAIMTLATRGPSEWSSQVINEPHVEATDFSIGSGGEYAVFSEDLSVGLARVFGNFDQLSPEATEETPYLRTLYKNGDVDDHCTSSCYRPLVTASNTPPNAHFGSGETTNGVCITSLCGPLFEGATPDLSHVVLESEASLTSVPVTMGLYEWGDGKLQLVSVLPHEEGGVAVAGQFGDREGGELGRAWQHAISDDGTRIVWAYNSHEPGLGLYLRDTAKEETTRIDLPEGGTGPSREPSFMAASSDLSRIFFLDEGPLTANALADRGDRNLYEYNLDAPAGSRLTDLTQSEAQEVERVIGVSDDGSYVYYAAHNELFEYHDGVTTKIAAPGNMKDWGASGGLYELTARVSPSGRWFTFVSALDLTGYDTRDAVSGASDMEVYLYDGEKHKLVCASCNPTGARPVGRQVAPTAQVDAAGVYANAWVSAVIPPWDQYRLEQARYQSRYLSNSGRLFFDSNEALVPQDVNGTMDVYEYEPPGVGSCTEESVTFSERSGGCVGLISSGISPQESSFMDASETGGDVFFLTTASLLPRDVDTAYDIYDAHECSSEVPCYQAAAVSPPACDTGESCKAAESPQPAIFGAPSSETFSGAGNITPAAEAKAVRSAVTRAQKLAKALVACRKGKRAKRAACERQAKKRYGSKAARRARTSIHNGSIRTER